AAGDHDETHRDERERGDAGRDVHRGARRDLGVDEAVHDGHPDAHHELDHDHEPGPLPCPGPLPAQVEREGPQPRGEGRARGGQGRRRRRHRRLPRARTASTAHTRPHAPTTAYEVARFSKGRSVSEARTMSAMCRSGSAELTAPSHAGICSTGKRIGVKANIANTSTCVTSRVTMGLVIAWATARPTMVPVNAVSRSAGATSGVTASGRPS